MKLSVSDLSFTYENKPIVENVNFQLREGEDVYKRQRQVPAKVREIRKAPVRQGRVLMAPQAGKRAQESRIWKEGLTKDGRQVYRCTEGE